MRTAWSERRRPHGAWAAHATAEITRDRSWLGGERHPKIALHYRPYVPVSAVVLLAVIETLWLAGVRQPRIELKLTV